MKYAINYNKNFRYFDEVDEIVLNEWMGSDSIIEFVPTIAKENQKVLIDAAAMSVTDLEKRVPALNMLRKSHSNILLQINLFTQKEVIQILKDNEIPYMFINKCRDFDTFVTMRDLGAEDIYIVEGLGFKLKALAKVKDNMRIRVFPDVAQSAQGCSEIKDITKFFIRPEDTKFYEDIVDVFEIYRNDDRESVVYDIYRNQKWMGDLKDLIMYFNTSVQNNTIYPNFGQERLNCGKKCSLDKCCFCTAIQLFSQKAVAAGLRINTPKVKREIPKEEKEEILNEIKGYTDEITID